MIRPRRILLPLLAALCASAVALPAISSGADPGTLSSRIESSRAQDQALQDKVRSADAKVRRFQRRIDELRAQQDQLQAGLDQDTARLNDLQHRLRVARARLVRLKLAVVRSQRVLADQLVGAYQAPEPDLVGVIINAKGFADLLEQVDQMKAVGRQNAAVVTQVRDAKAAVARQAAILAPLTARQQALVVTATAKRDAVAHLKLQVVQAQLPYLQARNRNSARLAALRSQRKALEQELADLQHPAIATSAFTGPVVGGADGYGFFQAPGTNYSVGDTPEIARRLNIMGQALHLHLIGLSGYRTPQHSVEVGGFANDPHTRGQASDTPGLEGVPEGTLNRYGLTRPFAGVAELDHVQLVGSI